METVKISTVVAWKVVNMTILPTFSFPKTSLDSEVGHLNGMIWSRFSDHRNNPANVLDSLFSGKFNFPINKRSNRILLAYKFLRPEIIAQYPEILACCNPEQAKECFGDVMELSKDFQYKHSFSTHTLS